MTMPTKLAREGFSLAKDTVETSLQSMNKTLNEFREMIRKW